jgi:hypothetical protein
VAAVNVTGLAGSVDVQDFDRQTGSLSLSVKTTKVAHLSATGTVNGLNYTADVGQANGTGSVAVFGTNGVKINAGTKASISLHIFNSGTNVGNVTVGIVSVDASKSASVVATIADEALGANAADTTGLVKVGNVTAVGASKASRGRSRKY